MEKVFIKPCEGRIVIHPKTGRDIPNEGCYVELDNHIERRIVDGDCIVVPQKVEEVSK